MSSWCVVRKYDYECADYGSMHLNETPTLYLIPSLSSRCSAHALATEWFKRDYESKRISLVEYRTRMRGLRTAFRLGVDSGTSCTDGIVSSLQQLMDTGWLNCRWRFISLDCDHFASESWEQSFVCCYRNAQCVISALFRLPNFRGRLFGALYAMPSVWKLQALLESAWALGFDPVGASQLASALRSANNRSDISLAETSASSSFDDRNLIGLVDSTVWLGASDLVSLFGSIGVRCTLLECRAPSGPNNSHPRLLEHIYSYITNNRPSDTTPEAFSAPMILQHEGHSRIVIGVEVDEADYPIALIALDPNTPVDAMRQVAEAAEWSRFPLVNTDILSGWSQAPYNWNEFVRILRVDARDLTHPQYQLLQVNGLIETEVDLQNAMAPENVTIAI